MLIFIIRAVLLIYFLLFDNIDELLLCSSNSNPSDNFYFHYDGLGSVVNLTKRGGQIVESYTYDVYGKPDQTSSVGNTRMFTGREYETETGLYYYRARYYSPQLGRFLQKDPMGLEGGHINLFNYAFNNPVNWSDPWGKQSVPIFIPPVPLFRPFPPLILVRPPSINISLPPPRQPQELFSKGGKQNIKDTGLEGKSNEEIANGARDKTLSGEERQRYRKEEKARKNRNKCKR